MPTAPAGDGFRGRVLKGLAWKVLSQVFGQAGQIVVTVVLARLLLPRDYGLAAMALVLSALVPIFADLALGAALVQSRELSEEDRSTVFWTSVATGGAFTILGVALAGPVAGFYGQPDVRPLLAVLSLSFVVTAIGTTHRALLNRELDFRSLELRQIAGTAAGGVVGISAALAGYGAWAIIGQQVAIAAVSTALLWVFSPWRPRFVYSLDSLRRLGGFSMNVFATRILFYGERNIDNLLVGRFLGAPALGAYTVAYNVMLSPLSRLGAPIAEVLFPAFARIKDDFERMASVWYRVNRLVGGITIPAMLGLAVVAPEFVRVVLGGHWDAAIPVVQILSFVGLQQSLQTLNTAILQACDRTGWMLRFAATTSVASVAAFVCGLHWGIVGVAVAYAISTTLVGPYSLVLTSRALGVSPWAFLQALQGVVQASVGMVAVVLATKLFLLDPGLPAALRLGILVSVGIAVYVPLCAWRAPEVPQEVAEVLRRRRSASHVTQARPAES